MPLYNESLKLYANPADTDLNLFQATFPAWCMNNGTKIARYCEEEHMFSANELVYRQKK